jgi:hypothetical protein
MKNLRTLSRHRGPAALILLSLLSLLPLPVRAAAPAAPPADDPEAVRRDFTAYKNALIDRDGATAAKLVSANSFRKYDQLRRLALSGTREELEKLSDVDRMLVLSMRLRTPRELLRNGSPEDLIAHSVSSSKAGSSVERAELGDIAFESGLASAQIRMGVRPVHGTFQFRQEDGRWKFDLEHALDMSRGTLKAEAEQKKLSEDELILRMLGAADGKPVGPEIWKPVVQP